MSDSPKKQELQEELEVKTEQIQCYLLDINTDRSEDFSQEDLVVLNRVLGGVAHLMGSVKNLVKYEKNHFLDIKKKFETYRTEERKAILAFWNLRGAFRDE